MGAVTIRNLDPAVKQKLRQRSAALGTSMEQHLRDIITDSLREPVTRRSLSVEKILALGVKPENDFDHKAVSDELYSYLGKE